MNKILIAPSNKEKLLPVADSALKAFFDIENNYFQSLDIAGEVLPNDVNPQYCDKVAASFSADLDKILSGGEVLGERHYSDEFIIGELVYHIEQRISSDELQTLFKQAKQRTVVERTLQTNVDDIQAFCSALKNCTLHQCWQLLRERIQVRVYPLDLAVKKFQDIDIDYFDNIPRNSEDLHPDLTPEYQSKVVESFTNEIDAILSADADDTFRLYTDDQIHRRLQSFTYPTHTADDIAELYDNARRRTLRERLANDNQADIAAFHHALQDVTVWECKDLMKKKLTTYGFPQ